MTVRTILQGDIPQLRRTSPPVTTFAVALQQLVVDLTDTLATHRALGLSAPQIGVDARVFVADVGNGLQVFVNAEVLGTSGSTLGYESCLSFPDHTLEIARPTHIKVRFQDVAGQTQVLSATGLLARVICHEVDHLDGILFMDHLSEESLFSQLLANAVIDEGFPGDEEEQDASPQAPDTPVSVDDETQQSSDDLLFVVDMLAELSWKLTLSLEMLRTDDRVQHRLPWSDLEHAAGVLENTLDALERLSAEPDVAGSGP